MTIDILVPALGESVTEATIAQWLKQEGDAVVMDEPIVELETDKVTLEINASSSGVLEKIIIASDETVLVGTRIGSIKEGAVANKTSRARGEAKIEKSVNVVQASTQNMQEALAPSVRKMTVENHISPSSIQGSGKAGRITKGDVIHHLETAAATTASAGPREERHKMSRLRKKIAQRLKEAQNTAAMLTTYNEVDMSHIMAIRKKYQDSFIKKHGCKLGFMSFFVKASINALKELPAVNAEIDGDEMVYKNYYNIGVAVGTEQGLVVPVLKDADQMGYASVEKNIAAFGQKARSGKLTMGDLSGGTFTISNGGVYGSLMSSPILNAPQSGILGMHKIQERPVAIKGEIQIRPMMYLALSYDHRIIDGREAVTFLVRLKECLEDPERLLLEI